MKNSVFIATSLDGYIAKKDGSVDWLMNVPQPESDEYSFNDFMSRIDALIMGRNTFQQVLTFGDWIYTKKVFVLSNTLKKIPEHLEEKVEIISGDIQTNLENLQNRGFKNFYIDGGKTIQSFLNLDLIDEMIITRVSVLLGEGIPLFESLKEQKDFKIVKTVKLNDFLVTTHFVRDY